MFSVGLDLGQRQDYSAIVVAERVESYPMWQTRKFHSVAVRHVERMMLGTPYPRVVERVKAIVQDGALRGQCRLTVDATGVGAAVVEMLKSARLGCELTAVTITGGQHARHAATGWNVPKKDLIGEVQVLLEKGELRIARELKFGGMLKRELLDMQARERAGGGVRTGAEGRGQHDDLVLALALACWKAKQIRNLNGPGRLF